VLNRSSFIGLSVGAGYMLEVNPDTRPDIYQVSYVAFQLAGRTCNVKNVNVRLLFVAKAL
jgi:hypothetical protein